MAGIDSDLIRGHIDTIILNILAEGDRYGYEICKEVENKSGGAYELKQPTLYSCLKRLESQGFISSYWEDSDIGGKRHYYKLTDEGLATYQKNQQDWHRSKQIIDNLISTEEALKAENAKANSEKASATVVQDETVDEPQPQNDGVLPGQTAFIFDEIDKEVESQDNGEALGENAILAPEDEAIKNGYEEVKDEAMPFDTTDYSAFCTPLVKNSDAQEQPTETTSTTIEETDDILALLGHYDEQPQEPEPQPSQPENEFLAKFITGKYSEFNPNKNDYLSQPEPKQDVQPEIPEPAPKVEESAQPVDGLIASTTDFDDEAEFGDASELPKIASFFDAPEEAHEITVEENKPENEVVTTFSFDDSDVETVLKEPQPPVDDVPENEPQPTPSIYSDITYYNINNNNDLSDISSESLFDGFAKKFDADTSSLSNDNATAEDDEIVLDLSKPNKDDADDAIAMDFSNPFRDEEPSRFDNYDEANEPEQNNYDESDDYSSFMAELEEKNIDISDVKPFENKVDLTSVYDKTGNAPISATYTDKDTKAKLNELAGSSINAHLTPDGNIPNELITDTTPPAYVATEQRVGPKDLSVLRSDLQQEGISVRPYYKTIKEPATTKTFIETNKIKMVRNWIVFFIQALLLGATLLATYKLNIGEKTFMGSYIYYACALGAIFMLAMLSSIKFWINPYKKVTAKYAPRISHLFALLFTVQFVVIIYCINLQFGFYSFTQTDYNHLNWIVPCVVSLTPIIGSIVYEILYKSKNFHI